MTGRWPAGRPVLRRHFMRDGILARVWAGHVAADDDHGLWLWVASGSTFRDIGAADGRAFREVPFGAWGRTDKALRELTWRGDMLMLHPRDGAYSLWFFFAPDGAFRTWYVNLEQPVTRWDDGDAAGVDTVDYDLDIVATPDRRWRWKDEDEFADHLAHPDVYWVDDAEAVRSEGKRVVTLIESGAFPFDGTGCDFRPSPQWPLPLSLPSGWDRRQA